MSNNHQTRRGLLQTLTKAQILLLSHDNNITQVPSNTKTGMISGVMCALTRAEIFALVPAYVQE